MKTRRLAWALLIAALILAVACGPRQDQHPNVTILSPQHHQTLPFGPPLQVKSRVRDDHGLQRVELRINGAMVDAHDVPQGEKSYRVEQSWSPPQAGTYMITVIAYDDKGQQSDAAGITVFVASAAATQEPEPPRETVSPSPSLTAPASAPPDCTYDATFVADLTIPDDTRMAPGTEFVKTWRMRNTGSCGWEDGFEFVFVDGEQMSGPAAVPVPPTAPGATADISVTQRAPDRPGTHRGAWRMRTPAGQEFGQRPYVQIVVVPPPTPTPPRTPSPTPGPQADLDITLIAGELALTVGEPLSLGVTVRNHGPGATSSPALVRAVLRAGLELEGTIPVLPPGAQETALLTHPFEQPADLEVYISVDPEDEIDEEDEANNVERVSLVVNPPVFTSGVLTATAGLTFDLDAGGSWPEQSDIEWRVVDGSVYLGLLNGAAAARLSGEVESISYALASGLAWQAEPLPLGNPAQGALFGFRTNERRVGYAGVEQLLDPARTSARLRYVTWDWR